MDDSVIEADEEESFFVPGFKDASSFSQTVLRTVVGATKASNELPSSGDNFDYYSTFPGFKSVLQMKGKSILSLMTSIIQAHGIREKFQGLELEDQLDLLIEVNDSILENASNCLDEASGEKKSEEDLIIAVKPPTAINTSWNKKQFNLGSPSSYKLLTAKNISRPQLLFKDKIDNSNTIFVPVIKEKPNSIKPLAITLEKNEDKEEFCHPYELEIEKFNPEEEHLQEAELVFPKSLEETPYMFVDTEMLLKEMCQELKIEKEIAVDLEHHSYRSFQGFTCLMQISSHSKDYIVDVLALRSQLPVLNDIFTDPKIVKVLHGADMDILWLQRDFGVYVVNMFDTGQAARVLHFAHLSLSYLLKHYCKLDVDKKFQLADWRIRPLPEEMIKYAREDTHYLLYVYDCLKNDLINQGNEMKNLLHSTFERSKSICLKKYQKPLFSDDKFMELYKKSRKMFNGKQLYCLKEIYSWRDRMAREYDESLLYVLPNHMLLQIAEALPREQQGILACCNPIPPLVKQQLNELHSIILKANEYSLKELESLYYHQQAQIPKSSNNIDLSSLIDCPHDIHHLEEKKVHNTESSSSEKMLPLRSQNHDSELLLKKKPSLSALFTKDLKISKPSENMTAEKKLPQRVIEAIQKLKSPFERFKVTTELQSNSLKKPEKNVVNLIVNHNEETANDSSLHAREENAESDVEEVVEELDTSEMPQADVSCEIISSTPIRKRKNKKKRKPQPDITLITTPESSGPQSKKSRSPEVVTVDDDSFTPYDYSQSDYNKFSGQPNTSFKSKKKKNQNYQTPRPYFGKNRKHAKQASFNRDGSGSSTGPSTQWPKK
ncbi:exosome complex component 10 [Parasteatoda tepidariorum]|uniref:exosome complex component 10 n=1 Tax=Parasteatoda tepidariorum TaxID=114398 RepID=UPI001C720451|nr:exosome component 10 [Parasteatoda tepidariorum]